ncbi:MAG: response regulator [Chloroflexi bacterium]|nr:response regulator [Chloroflexota bacterium]
MPDAPKCILVVEDDPDTAEMFAEMLRMNHYDVVLSYGGIQGLTLVSKDKPDAVLLDVMMPDISGLEVLRFIRRDPRLEHIPVVIVSAKVQPGDVRDGIDAGASLYLTKPVAYMELKEAVDRVTQG